MWSRRLGIVAVVLALALGADRARADDKDNKIKLLQAELDKTRQEAEELRKRNEVLTVALEKAAKDALAAANAERLARTRADDTLKKLEETLSRLRELKKDATPRQPPPLVPNLRATVTDVDGGFVTLDIGLDGGLAVGTVLDIYRVEGAKYLGTVKVVDAKKLLPKTAVATFTPARNVALDKLKPDELPKKGDQVRPISESTGKQ